MSRICVKNLPKHATDDRLRELFSRIGEVTDAKIMRFKNGKTRQFGFVGFRTEREAAEAVKYFNKSYIDTIKISCEIAHEVRDPDIPRPWSRHSLQKYKNSAVEEKKVTGSKVSKAVKQKGKSQNHVKGAEKNDRQYKEFIELMQPHSKSKMWANDTVAALSCNSGGAIDGIDDNDSDDDNVECLYMNNCHPIDNRLEPDFSEREAEDGFSRECENGSYEPSPNLQREKDEVLASNRLYICNIPYSATEEEVEDHFSKYGAVSQVHIVINKETRHSEGYGFVLFAQPESAARALEETDNSTFQGRSLHVMPAKQKEPFLLQKNKNDERMYSKSLKHQRNEERKLSEKAGNTRAWNSLYMRPDTVVENIARKFGVSKSELLDRESDDLAVRIALGETQVIAETKKALSRAGVNVSSLEELATGKTDGTKRSNHIILVKNLSYGSSESELASMFGRFGSLDKIIFPPTKTLALVIFLEAAQARVAFEALTYKCYKDSPLYLEWAPINILSQTLTVDTVDECKVVGALGVNRAVLKQQFEDMTGADADPDRIESRSLYVKNLNFRTSDETLRKHFAEHMKGGKILSVKAMKRVENGKSLSAGFGFIEFDSVDTAVKVCKDLQGTVLDGHALILKLCHSNKKETTSKKVQDGMSSTKLILKNVAFEATKKDLKQLFSPFGQIKSLRLPTKFGNHGRGFAFVEFATKQEAQNALEAFANTHLYGRHLVLERAKEEESLHELRAKRAAQFTGSDKLSKKRKHLR